MKTVFLVLSLLLPIISFSADEKISAVKELIESYQNETLGKTGNYISIVFNPEQRFQANAKIYADRSLITIYAGLVKEMTPLELVSIACHEIGHILGEIKEANVIGGGVRQFREAVEGEADYFGGGCLRKYLEETVFEKDSKTFAAEVAASAYQKLHHSRVPLKASLARTQKVIGILPAYPSPECRLLTVLNGIAEKERPKCWYNPSLSEAIK
jgi:hypothetical protein